MAMWTVATAEPRLTTCPLGARRRADPRVHVVSSCERFSRQTTTSVWLGATEGGTRGLVGAGMRL
jgi:hypothetical protein